MRRLFVVSLLALAAACGAGEPDPPVLLEGDWLVAASYTKPTATCVMHGARLSVAIDQLVGGWGADNVYGTFTADSSVCESSVAGHLASGAITANYVMTRVGDSLVAGVPFIPNLLANGMVYCGRLVTPDSIHGAACPGLGDTVTGSLSARRLPTP